MFNRLKSNPEHLNPEHLLDTTLPPKDAIAVAYINISNQFHPETSDKTREFSMTDISREFKCQQVARYGDQFRIAVKKKLESVFCAVVVSDNEEKLMTALSLIKGLLCDSTKWPLIIVVTNRSLSLEQLESMQDLNQLIAKKIQLPDTLENNNIMNTKLSEALGVLYGNTKFAVYKKECILSNGL